MAIASLERLGIAQAALQPAGTLSGGQQQRVAIARALMQQPKVILADEPIASLDPLNAKIVMDALQDINLRDGITVITNLHTLDTARAYCNRIVGMAAGKVVFDGAPEDLTRDAVRMIYGADGDGQEISEAITSTSIRAPSRKTYQSAGPLEPALRGALSCRDRLARVTGAFRRNGKRPAQRRATTGETSCSGKHSTAPSRSPLSWSARAQAEDLKEFRIGLIGGENEADRLRNFQCLVDKLPAVLGVEKVSLFPAADYDGTIQGLLGGTLDYAELGASGYAKIYLEDKDAVEPILTTVQTDGSTGYYSIMVATKASGITKLEDLKGKKLGFADPDSTSGYLIPVTRCRRTSAARP